MIEHMFDSGCEPIPAGLDEMPPGPVLAALLASIDPERVSGHDRVVVLRAAQRLASHAQAQVWAAMGALADHMDRGVFADDPGLAWEAAATEIRAALRRTRRAAEAELDVALGLRRRLPKVWEAMVRGDVDGRRAWVILQGTSHLEEAAARRVVESVIEDAPRLTTGELAARLRRLCIEADPEAAARRYEARVQDRRVVVEATPEGTAHLFGLDLPPDRVDAAARRIDHLARSLGRNGETRSLDQLRADVFMDLLCGTRRQTSGAGVEIRVDLDTLTRLADTPGDLGGYGPVIADVARQVAEAHVGGQWRFTITDPVTGLAVHDGTTRRRPTGAQRRSVEARDRTCVFPGCRIPATQCDLDHRTPWSQRRNTAVDGLDAACRHDHVTVRHLIGWTHRPLPGGDHLWTSHLGHDYTRSGLPP
jgi:hypothetical protein